MGPLFPITMGPIGPEKPANPENLMAAKKASSLITSSGMLLPLLTPLQSLNSPWRQSSSGRQKPYSLQQGRLGGQPAGQARLTALKGAAGQLPRPSPAPRRLRPRQQPRRRESRENLMTSPGSPQSQVSPNSEAAQ